MTETDVIELLEILKKAQAQKILKEGSAGATTMRINFDWLIDAVDSLRGSEGGRSEPTKA